MCFVVLNVGVYEMVISGVGLILLVLINLFISLKVIVVMIGVWEN